MNQEEKLKLVEVITGAAEVMRSELSPIGLTLYVEALADLELERVREAFGHLVRNQRFLPAPSEIREALGAMDGTAEDRALLETTRVMVAVDEIGDYQTVVFDDPVTMAVIRDVYGGWPEICGKVISNRDDLDRIRRDFTKHYRSFAACGIQAGGQLPGRFPQAVHYIGDRRRAEAVEHMPAGKLKYETQKLVGGKDADKGR